jgi:hypothetical protein
VDNEISEVHIGNTETVLRDLAARQDALTAELERKGLTGFVARSEWLIAQRTPDEQLVWERQLTPEPRVREKRLRGTKLTWSELVEEIDFLHSQGCNRWEIAGAVGVPCENLSRQAYRKDRPDLGRALNPDWAERNQAA